MANQFEESDPDHDVNGKPCRTCGVVHREHDIGSRECWCHPEVVRGCHECESVTGVLGQPVFGCYECGGRGLVTVTSEADIDDPPYPLVLVHQPDGVSTSLTARDKRRAADAR